MIMGSDMSTKQDLDRVCINKDAKVITYPFSYLFKGFENVSAVKQLFGKDTKKVLSKLRVAVYEADVKWGGYLWVDEKNKCIVCNLEYIKTEEKKYVYLDVVHELVHIRQLLQKKELFDVNYAYTDRPTELEAYKVTVEEARRLGMKKQEIVSYLRAEWIPEKEFKQFIKHLGLPD